MKLQYKFDSSDNAFFSELRSKVDHYFESNDLHTTGEWRLYSKGLLQVLSLITLYVVLVFFTPPTWLAIILCMLMGVNFAAIGFNVMHEGGHQSFSRFKWLNHVASYFLNVLGGSIYYWKKKHNVNHHTFTNVEGMDSDIDVGPFMRLHDGQPRFWYHRFQHIYWVVLYGISYLAWIFYDDFKKYFTGQATATSGRKKMEVKEHVIFWSTKLSYVTLYMLIPIYFVGWLPWLVGFLTITFTCGLFISIVFQLAHVVEDTSFHSPEGQTVRQEWAVHQLTSTSNFATRSKFLYWLLGGLNFQIEHHLFPRISHIHYPQIGKLIKETCEEYNVPYFEYKTMFAAVWSHLTHLKKLGSA